jgi:hypothetical protein
MLEDFLRRPGDVDRELDPDHRRRVPSLRGR